MSTDPTKLTDVPLRLQARIAEHLAELAETLGTSADRVVESLVEREYAARAKQLAEPSPWEITEQAIRDVAQYLRRPPAELRDVLETACVDAALAEKEGRRRPSKRADGRMQYRGPGPQRFTLIVDGRRLVGVTRSGR